MDLGDEELNVERNAKEIIFSVFPPQDEFDGLDFDVYEYLNNLFADEKSLYSIDHELGRLKYYVQDIDNQLINCMSKQNKIKYTGEVQLNSSKAIINELYDSIFEVESKAVTCKDSIGEICKNINFLDISKNNLLDIIKTLNTVSCIVDKIECIKTVFKTGDYEKLMKLLKLVNKCFVFFSESQNERVEEIREVYEHTKDMMKVQIFNEFEFVDVSKCSSGKFSSLCYACLAIEAMGKNIKAEFFFHFSSRQLSIYNLQFKANAEISQLRHVDQRYKWCSKWLTNYENNYEKLFPASWQLDEFVVVDFCASTRRQMVEVLGKSGNQINVKELKHALKTTIKFESVLIEYYTRKLQNIPVSQLSLEISQINTLDVPANFGTVGEYVTIKFTGAISDCFENYMYLYVDYQELIIKDKFMQIINEETWTVEHNSVYKVFSSARSLIELLSKLQNSFCNLNKSKVYFDLVSLFPRFLESYMSVLSDNLSQLQAKPTLKTPDQIQCCIIVNTTNYMCSMVSLTEMVIKDQILPELKNHIDFSLQQKTSASILSSCLEVLNNSIFSKLNTSFAQIKTLKWDDEKTSITDASPYMLEVTRYLKKKIPILKFYIFKDIFDERVIEEQYRPDYFMVVCDAIVVGIIKSFETCLKSCTKISETGAQQLLLDLTHLRNTLLTLPLANWSPNSSSGDNCFYPSSKTETLSQSYTKRVIKEMEDVQNVIKVIMTPEGMLFETYNMLIADKSKEHFVEIMQLKGISISNQKLLLKNFNY